MILDAVFTEEQSLNADFGTLFKGDKGDKGDKGEVDYTLVANALKGNASGSAIALTDVSPFEHILDVMVSRKNYFPRFANRTYGGIALTVDTDGTVHLNGSHTGAYNFKIENLICQRTGTYYLCDFAEGDFPALGHPRTAIKNETTGETVSIAQQGASNQVVSIYMSEGDVFTVYIQARPNHTYNCTLRPTLLFEEIPTAYIPYADISTANVIVNGTDTYPIKHDGTVGGIKSVYPEMTLTSDTDGIVLVVTYNVDIKKYIDEKTNTPERLRVCSYNVGRYNNGVYADTIENFDTVLTSYKKFFAKNNIDILCGQEETAIVNSNNMNEMLYNTIFPNVNHVGANGIHSIYGLDKKGNGTFTDGSRPYVYATVNIGGKDVFVLNAHLALTTTERANNITELLEILARHERFIVFGDFNAGKGGTIPAELAEEEFKRFTDKGYKIANGGYLPFENTIATYETTNVLKYYDNIITSGNIIIRNVEVVNMENGYSDHFPIIADVVI